MKKNVSKVLFFFGCLMMMLCVVNNANIDAAKNKPKLNKKKITLNLGQKKKLKVLCNKAKVKWYSKNKKIATVSRKGKVTGKSAGTTYIYAKIKNKKLKCKVTVRNYRSISRIEIPKKDIKVVIGGNYEVKVNIFPKNATNKKLKWQSNDAKIVTVKDGVLHGVAEGKTQVWVTTNNGKTDYCNVTVTYDYIKYFNSLSNRGRAVMLALHKIDAIMQKSGKEFNIISGKFGILSERDSSIDEYVNLGDYGVRIYYKPVGSLDDYTPSYMVYGFDEGKNIAFGSYDVAFDKSNKWMTRENISLGTLNGLYEVYKGLKDTGYDVDKLLSE